MTRATRVLVVEDDEQTRTLLAAVLAETGYTVSAAASAEEALALLDDDVVDVVLSDIRLRDLNGIDVLTAARARPLPPEVILLTGYASVETSVAALRGDAFDYLLKPVATEDLIAAVAAAGAARLASARRAAALRVLLEELDGQGRQLDVDELVAPDGERGRYQSVGGLQIDTHRRTAAFAGTNLHVTPIEYALLRCLAEAPGRVVPCDEIVRHTHGYSVPLADAQALLRGHVRNLRRKIPDGYLVTVRGTGYMLVAPDEAG